MLTHRRPGASLALALLVGAVGMHFEGEAPPPAGGTPPPAPGAGAPAASTTVVTPPALPPEVQAQLDKLKDLEKFKADTEEATKKADRERMSETEKLKAEVADANARAIAANRQAVAARLGLPAELADRLRGDTLQEIEADAAGLAKLIPAAAPPANTGGAGGSPPPAANPTELAKKRDELTEARKKGDRFACMKLEREVQALEASSAK